MNLPWEGHRPEPRRAPGQNIAIPNPAPPNPNLFAHPGRTLSSTPTLNQSRPTYRASRVLPLEDIPTSSRAQIRRGPDLAHFSGTAKIPSAREPIRHGRHPSTIPQTQSSSGEDPEIPPPELLSPEELEEMRERAGEAAKVSERETHQPNQSLAIIISIPNSQVGNALTSLSHQARAKRTTRHPQGVLGRRLIEQKRQSNAEVLRAVNQERLRPRFEGAVQRDVGARGGVSKRKAKEKEKEGETTMKEKVDEMEERRPGYLLALYRLFTQHPWQS